MRTKVLFCFFCPSLIIGCNESKRERDFVFTHSKTFFNGKLEDSEFVLKSNPQIVLIKKFDLQGRLFFVSYFNHETRHDSLNMFDESGKLKGIRVYDSGRVAKELKY